MTKEVREDEVVDALKRAHKAIKEIIDLQERMVKEVSPPPKGSFPLQEIDPELKERVYTVAVPKIERLIKISDKKERGKRETEAFNEVLEDLNDPEREAEVRFFWEEITRELVRRMILVEGKRADGRAFDEIRPISAYAGVLPRTHGSGLFRRGQTQALVVTTLGTTTDEQIVDDIEGRTSKRFMLHYYFPPFSVGEARPLRGPGRREIGHGALAEKALFPVLPSEERFPYTIRLVSDILDSNGSTSMATVCGGTLALMDAGVPIAEACAGISVGLVKEGDKVVLLRDITGLEDAGGDMDFKIAGTRRGITALQLDLKIDGISYEIIEEALGEAREGRLFILDEMKKAISKPRERLSVYAPRVIRTSIPPEKIGDVIGPGGRTIRNIINTTGAMVDIEDDGKVTICAPDEEASTQTLEMIEYLTAEVEVGKTYLGKVLRVTKFGAFVEILPGKEGLVHISELAPYRVSRVEDIVSEGDEIRVKVIEIDDQGRINLSRRRVLYEQERSGRKR
jgi:polyribonucleotide nucleotidyltransferase